MSSRPTRELPVPPFYRRENAALWSYQPELPALAGAAREWRREHGIAAAADDRARIHLLLVDVQRDFCLPQGSLYVGGRTGNGALEDVDRLTRWIYRHLDRISEITATLDTHVPFQIFSPEFWVDASGRPLTAHREVLAEEVRSGAARPDPALAAWLAPGGDPRWLERQALAYCEALERGGRYRLYLWPPHCLAGGEGHCLSGVVQEARLFHAWARRSPGHLEPKGATPLSESYSALAPEVLLAFDGRPLGGRNRALEERLRGADAVVVAGEAASHCVRSTLADLLGDPESIDPEWARRIWILEDCMSAVAVPDPEGPGGFRFDFTGEAEEALNRFARAGCRRLLSTDPLPVP
jgi:nicotinamidase-related amidase